MTEQEIQALEAAAKAANNVSWLADKSEKGEWFVLRKTPFGRMEDVAAVCATNGYGEHEAQFIATANPTAILSLIARIAELERQNGELLKLLCEVCDIQERHYGDAMRTHIALIGLAETARKHPAIASATGKEGA